MNIDDLIRDTVRQQEQLAADPDRIRAALPARAARRQRARTRAMLATVAAVVAVAVSVPVIVMRDNGTENVAATVPEDTTIPLYYMPTWLPDGMVERIRSAPLEYSPDARPITDRSWSSTSVEDQSGGYVTLMSYPQSQSADREPNVDINGTPGYYDGSDSVTWLVDDDTKLTVQAPLLDLPEDVLLRIARSVKPDPARWQPPLRLGWLPDGAIETGVRVQGDSPTKWWAVVGVHDQHYLDVSLATTVATEYAGRGEAITTNGRTAYLAEVDEGTYFQVKWVLTMDVGEGRYLTIRSGVYPDAPEQLTRDEVIRIAENAQIDPNPDVGWLGR